MGSLSKLKKQSKNLLAKVKQRQEENSISYKNKDERIWTPTFNKEKGSGRCVVRFLLPPEGEELPFIDVYSHAFKGPTGNWYINNSLSTRKEKDPVGELISRLFKSGVESDKEVYKSLKLKRKHNIYANVLVIDDPEKPENNGTVKIYRYGPMIAKILEEAMFPNLDLDPDAEPLNPFCPCEGADFVIKIVGKQLGKDLVPNYEKSEFKAPSALFDGDDDKIDEVWKKTHSLTAFHSDDNFKSYEDLRKRLYEVLGPTVGSGVAVVEGWEDDTPPVKTETKSKSKVEDTPDGDSNDDGVSPVNESDNDLPGDSSDSGDSSSDMSDEDFFNSL